MKKLIRTTLLSFFSLLLCLDTVAAIKAGDASVDVGSTTTISLAATYQNTLRQSSGVSARWSTSSSNVTITSQNAYSCTIKGVTAGTAQVNYYCSYTLNGYYRTMDFYYTVTINSGVPNLTISPTSITLDEGDTYSVTAYQPGYVGGVYFTSSNSNIASVSTGSNNGYYTYGTITAKSEGTTYIYAKSANGATSPACTVTVKAKIIKPTSILVLPGNKTIEEGEYASLSATVSPSNATYTLTWSSSDTNVATVTSSGRVYGKKPGTARITAKINGYSLSDYCDVTVKAKPVLATSISADVPTEMYVEDTYQLSPSYEPSNATVAFTYASDNTDIVSVSSTGLLTANGTGSATITLTETRSQLKKTFVIVVSSPIIPDTDIYSLDNVIYIENTDCVVGQELTLSFLMKNSAAIRGFQFDLYLPDGVSVVKSAKGKIQGALSTSRLPDEDEHQLTFSEQEDGAIRFLCGSQYDETFTGSDGEIVTLQISIAQDMEEGDYPILLKNIVLNETDITKHYDTDLLKSTLAVTSYILGDINGDGIVNVLDYTGVANRIHGNTPEGFIEKAADVNGDKIINVLDYTGIANIIHTGSASGRSNARKFTSGYTQAGNTDISTLDNVVYITPFTTSYGMQTTLSIHMKNTALIRSFQFDLYLPEGISVVKSSKGRIQGALNPNRLPEEDQHLLTFSEQPDGAIRFLCGSEYDENFIGNDGEIATLLIDVSAHMSIGDYPIYIKDITLSETDIKNHYDTELVESTVTISEPADTRVVLDETTTRIPTAATGVDVRVLRTIKANQWSTICLPFAMNEAQVKEAFGSDVQLADFTGYETEENDEENTVGIKVNFEAVTAIEANHPYIIKVSETVTEFTADEVDIEPEEKPTKAAVKRTRKQWSEMIGTYVAETTIEDQMLFIGGGKFYYSTGLTKMQAFRAYFDFFDVLTDVEEASVKVFVDIDNEETRVDEIVNCQSSNDKLYDLSGRKVTKPNQHGIYITNGKKVMF